MVDPNQLEKIKFHMYRSDLKLFNGFLFADFKYLMAYSIPLTALIGVYLGGYWLFLTPVYIFVLIPITEFILTSFDVDELEKQRSEKVIHWIFDTMLYLNIPIVFGLLFLFLNKNMLIPKAFQRSNIDCTIILQSPKVGSYISKIRKNISKMLELNEKKVSIKATTTDYLGYIGQSKGWSAISIATISEINENS